MRLFVKLDPSTEIGGKYFYDFSNELALAEVIVGAGSTVARQKVFSALGDLDATVTVRKARLAFRSYKIVEQRSPQVWT